MSIKPSPKNLLLTKTVMPLMGSGLALIVLAAPHLGEIAKRRLGENLAKDVDDVVAIVLLAGGLSGLGAAAKGRYQATDNVYTPWPLPGRRLTDVEAQADESDAEQPPNV